MPSGNYLLIKTGGILSKRDSQGKLVKTPKDPLTKKQNKPTNRTSNANNVQSFRIYESS